jgi:hypothetical protein
VTPAGVVVLLAVLAAAAFGVVLLRRRAVLQLAARRNELLPALASHVDGARPGSRLPAGVPEIVSPFLPGGPAIEVLAEGRDRDARCYLYDVDARYYAEQVPGYNTSLGGVERDVPLSSHTVLAWYAAGADLPDCRILPNPFDAAGPSETLDAAVRRVGLDPQDPRTRARAEKIAAATARIAQAVAGDPETWSSLRQGSGALPFPGAPAFEAAYRVLGEDCAAIRRLLGAKVVDVLLGQPGVIAECAGDWLFVSLNTRVLSPAATGRVAGLLKPDRAELLVGVGTRLWRSLRNKETLS